jgi:2-keto-4-pentenoate hydratase/2-oxohepta-3-ene-1,7-dioic acid hydratase in catechol pathway
LKLVTFEANGILQIGAEVNDRVIHLNQFLSKDEQLPENMVSFLALGDGAMQLAKKAIDNYSHKNDSSLGTPTSQTNLQSPVLNPSKIMMGGRNYLRHLDELRKEGASRQEKIVTPPMPHIFSKYSTAITGPNKPIIYPKIVKQLDLEGELTVIIGKRAYHVEEDEALDYVAGYTIMNDVSARCLQAQGLLLISKGFETFCPMGPYLVTKDEIPDPQNLSVKTYLNDLEVCTAHTSEMLFSVKQFISSLSRMFPLEPGDVLSTGSPPGPGMYHNPPILAKVGDVMRITIESIGTLSNPVIAAVR